MYLKAVRVRLYTTAQHLLHDRLFLNSFFLMLSTAVLAGFGFLFWVLSARLVPTATVGLATTLVSVMSMISMLSLVGFDTAIVRFLSRSGTRDETISTGIFFIALAACVLSVVFVASIGATAPQLLFVQDSAWFSAAFVVFCVFGALNLFMGAVFLAHRQTKFTLMSNSSSSVVKIFLPLVFVSWGAFGIFSAAATSQLLEFFFCLYVLVTRFGFRPHLAINGRVVAEVWRYSVGNYAANLFYFLPTALLPIVITNTLGPVHAAYFYVVMMIGAMLYMIPAATSRSLLAEGSHDEGGMVSHVESSMRTMALFLLPAIAVILLAGKYLLAIFGPQYAAEGSSFLYLIALSGVVVGVYSLYASLLRITMSVRVLVAINILYAASIFALSYLLLPLGLVGIGVAWLLGNAFAALLSFLAYRAVQNGALEELQGKWSDFSALVVRSKLLRMRARLLRPHTKRVVLCYPHMPQFFHTLYMVCHCLGYTITNDPSAPYDIAVAFEDTTVRAPNPQLVALEENGTVINGRCGDISKTRVESVFKEVFGYGAFVDPRTYRGPYIKKSDNNAMHDGEVCNGPREPEPGYIYQKLIGNETGEGEVYDIRVACFGGIIPSGTLRYRSVEYRFDTTDRVVLKDTAEILSQDEIAKVEKFCDAFGLQYGEIDLVRDAGDGRVYIVDVNTTPAGPRPGPAMSAREFNTFIRTLSEGFESLTERYRARKSS